jgi:TPR repeat protein
MAHGGEAAAAGQIPERMLQRAQQGYIQDQLTLGTMYRDGKGVVPNSALAMYWFRRAADSGSPEAQLQVGTLLLLGEGGTQNALRAAEWFQRAAVAQYPPAIYNLGLLCLRETLPNCDDGIEKISRSATLGYAPAQTVLGNALIDGKYGLAINPTKGMEWLSRAAKQDFPNAEYSLGLLYMGNQRIGADLAKSLGWFKKAAAQGFAPAEDVLGRIYLLGKGQPIDLQKAEIMLTAATEHGSRISFLSLAYLHLQQRRFDKAYFDVLCAEQSSELKQIRMGQSIKNVAQRNLSKEELARIEISANSWKRVHAHVHDAVCHHGTCTLPPNDAQSIVPTPGLFH